MLWRKPAPKEEPPEAPTVKSWTFYVDDSLRERARKIAEVALADCFPNATLVMSMLPRATLRVLDALERYAKLDAEKGPSKGG